MQQITFDTPKAGGLFTTGVYTELGAPEENPWQSPTAAAVGPRGQFIVRHFTKGRTGEMGDVPIRSVDGAPVLSPRYRAAGWVMYDELCLGHVPGIAADMVAWQRWQTLIKCRAHNVQLPEAKLGDSFFHPEVARRRQNGGVTPRLTNDQLRELFPGVDIPDETDATEIDD